MAEDYENIKKARENLTEEDENILLWAALGATAASDIFVTRIESEEEEYLENLQIIFAEELYQELCRVLGSDKMKFMGIA